MVLAAPGAGAQDSPPATQAPAAGSTELRVRRSGSFVVGGQVPDLKSLKEKILAAAWKSEAGKRAMRELGLTEEAARAALAVRATLDSGIRVTLTLPKGGAEVLGAATRFVEELTEQVATEELAALVDEANRRPVLLAEAGVVRARQRVSEASEEAAKQRQVVRAAAQGLDPSPEAVRTAASR
jgi:hypothetical protein